MNYLIFGIGNFGDKYKNTRHNAGKIVLEYLNQEKYWIDFLKEKKIEIFTAECFMNESGIVLKKFLKNKKYKNENIIIFYDDKDIEIGKVKLSINKSDGGHNGIKNIIQNLANKDFYRLRIGIGEKGIGKDGKIPVHGEEVQKFVLGNLKVEEKNIFKDKRYLEEIFEKIKMLVK